MFRTKVVASAHADKLQTPQGVRHRPIRLLAMVSFVVGLAIPAGAVWITEPTSKIRKSLVALPCANFACQVKTIDLQMASRSTHVPPQQTPISKIDHSPLFLMRSAVPTTASSTWFLDAPLGDPDFTDTSGKEPKRVQSHIEEVRALAIFRSLPIKVASQPLAALTSGSLAFAAGDAKYDYCSSAGALQPLCNDPLPVVWDDVLREAQRFNKLAQLNHINRKVNSLIRYRSDLVMHAVNDVWMPPRRTMHTRVGDCEDFALVKMWLLAKLGFEIDDLYIIVVKSEASKAHHAVLALRDTSAVYILDNLRDQVLSESQIANYVPVFSVSHSAIWLHGHSAPAKLAALP